MSRTHGAIANNSGYEKLDSIERDIVAYSSLVQPKKTFKLGSSVDLRYHKPWFSGRISLKSIHWCWFYTAYKGVQNHARSGPSSHTFLSPKESHLGTTSVYFRITPKTEWTTWILYPGLPLKSWCNWSFRTTFPHKKSGKQQVKWRCFWFLFSGFLICSSSPMCFFPCFPSFSWVNHGKSPCLWVLSPFLPGKQQSEATTGGSTMSRRKSPRRRHSQQAEKWIEGAWLISLEYEIV